MMVYKIEIDGEIYGWVCQRCLGEIEDDYGIVDEDDRDDDDCDRCFDLHFGQ